MCGVFHHDLLHESDGLAIAAIGKPAVPPVGQIDALRAVDIDIDRMFVRVKLDLIGDKCCFKRRERMTQEFPRGPVAGE